MNIINHTVGVLQSCSVTIIPTDTVLGLACNAFSEDACNLVYKIKNRDFNKPLAIFVPSVQWIFDNCFVSSEIEEFCYKNLPGRYTLLLRLKNDVIKQKLQYTKIKSDGIVGVRIPNHDFCLELSKEYDKVGGMLCATSVNVSGFDPCKKA